MLDNQITEEERAAIDAWLAENKPKVIPQGKVYYDVTDKINWREKTRQNFFAKMRQKQFARQQKAEQIRPLAAQGLSDQEISQRLDIHPKTVYNIRSDFGITAGLKLADRVTLTDEVLDALTDEWQETGKICTMFQRGPEATRGYLRRLEKEGRAERTPIVPGNIAKGYKWRRKL